MGLSVAGRNAALDALGSAINAISLHSGDPGAAGTANEVAGGGYSRQAPSWAAASAGAKALSANLAFTTPALQSVTYYGLWAAGVFYGSGQITAGDVAANAAGQYELTTATQLTIT